MDDQNFQELPSLGKVEVDKRRNRALAILEGVKRTTKAQQKLDASFIHTNTFKGFFKWLLAAVVFGLLAYFYAKEWLLGVVISLFACFFLAKLDSSYSEQWSALEMQLDEFRFQWVSHGHQPSHFDQLLYRSRSKTSTPDEYENWWGEVEHWNTNSVRRLFGLPELSKEE